MKKPWKTFLRHIRTYFRHYSGWKSIAYSPLFHISFIITIVSGSQWADETWIKFAESTIPSLLGFSLGTYAILFSLINPRIKVAFRSVKNEKGVSWLHAINATFFHFIFIQTLTLIYAMTVRSFIESPLLQSIVKFLHVPPTYTNWAVNISNFLGALLLFYSILLIVGAALAIYRISTINDPAEGETKTR